MDDLNNIEQRLLALEIKATYTEDLLDQLDLVAVRQQQQIDLLIRELARSSQLPSDAGLGGPRLPHDDLPPHY